MTVERLWGAENVGGIVAAVARFQTGCMGSDESERYRESEADEDEPE
jgi:hypothetical protein